MTSLTTFSYSSLPNSCDIVWEKSSVPACMLSVYACVCTQQKTYKPTKRHNFIEFKVMRKSGKEDLFPFPWPVIVMTDSFASGIFTSWDVDMQNGCLQTGIKNLQNSSALILSLFYCCLLKERHVFLQRITLQSLPPPWSLLHCPSLQLLPHNIHFVHTTSI